MDANQPSWIAILRDEVAKTNATQVAGVIGYSRTAVSLVLAGKYNGGTDQIAKSVMDAYSDRLMCPHLKADITPSDCRSFQAAPMPQSEPRKLKHWMACRTCPLADPSHNQMEAEANA